MIEPEAPLTLEPVSLRPTWTYFLVPGAIVLAGLVVAASIVVTNGQGLALFARKAPKTGTISYTLNDIKNWAKKIHLDSKAFNACVDARTFTSRVQQDADSALALGFNGTPSFFINGASFVGAQPFEAFQKAIDTALANPQQAAQPLLALQAADHIQGNADAPVTIMEYSDFQCPFCRSFFDNTLTQIRKTYVDTGRVKLVYRHLPLQDLHPMAQISAEASECAAAQNKFWEMHDAIFKFQAQ